MTILKTAARETIIDQDEPVKTEYINCMRYKFPREN